MLSMLIGTLILSSFQFLPDPITAIAVVFVASIFINMAMPAVNAAYADYISEDTEIEGEIAGLGDFAFNLGYIFGPISAGFLADWLGMNISFTLVGVLGVIISLVLLTWSPKHINIEVSPAEWR